MTQWSNGGRHGDDEFDGAVATARHRRHGRVRQVQFGRRLQQVSHGHDSLAGRHRRRPERAGGLIQARRTRGLAPNRAPPIQPPAFLRRGGGSLFISEEVLIY